MPRHHALAAEAAQGEEEKEGDFSSPIEGERPGQIERQDKARGAARSQHRNGPQAQGEAAEVIP